MIDIVTTSIERQHDVVIKLTLNDEALVDLTEHIGNTTESGFEELYDDLYKTCVNLGIR